LLVLLYNTNKMSQQTFIFANKPINSITFSGLENPSHYSEDVDLLSKPFYIRPGFLEFSFTNLDIIDIICNKIDSYITSIEGLHSTFDTTKKSWEVEYGINPMERIMTAINLPIENKKLQNRLIKSKQWWIICAMNNYQNKKCRALISDEEHDFYEKNLNTPNKWTKFLINLFYDKTKNTVIVEFHSPFRETDDNTYFYFKRNISSIIIEELRK